ncbi:MAG: metallophosphoesterase family protein [Actinobacteria bacterium]|nr:metallophosphoesterase family protein [Actinomycetota bacterium]
MLALIYDVHGNLPALEAVLSDAAGAGATHHLLGGDYGMLGSQPTETIARLHALPADTIWLRGNTERWVRHPESEDIPFPAIADACRHVADALGHSEVAELAALPQMLSDVPVAGAAGVIFCHASPGSDMIGFFPQAADTDGTAATSDREANTIVCGHTHMQFRREIGVIEVVNPGSVGLPLDGDTRAAYALLAPDGSFELRRVEYDVEAAVAAYGTLETEWAEIAKRRLRTGAP